MWPGLLALFSAAGAVFSAQVGRAALVHETVLGAPIEVLELAPGAAAGAPTTAKVTFADLQSPKAPGLFTLSFEAPGGAEAVLVPHCASRGRVLVNGAVRDPGSKGPLVLRLEGEGPFRVKVEITASAYEKRIACAEPPRAGKIASTYEGFSVLQFDSRAGRGKLRVHADQGQAVVYVPRGLDTTRPAKLLVGVHPWNGGPWTYAAYREQIEEAEARKIVLLMPSGLGNSLYTSEAENEVMDAIDALGRAIAIDPQRTSIWGASMGGAGATTISFHRPDRFAFVASWFGDSKYDLTTYVKSVLGGEAGAHKVNALDIVENARHVPVFLVHGEIDKSSPVVQSTMLDAAMKKAGFDVTFERVPGMGHEGPLVAKYLRQAVSRADAAAAPMYPARVSYRSVRGEDRGAYGVRIVPGGPGDNFVDVEGRADGVHVLAVENVRQILLEPGALGVPVDAPVHGTTSVVWGP